MTSFRSNEESCAALRQQIEPGCDQRRLDALARSLPILERKVGRIVFNGFPTGVEVSYAMVHGGPFPATSNSRTTSVGAAPIERFLRPIYHQDMPEALPPEAVQEANPFSHWRHRDRQYVQR